MRSRWRGPQAAQAAVVAVVACALAGTSLAQGQAPSAAAAPPSAPGEAASAPVAGPPAAPAGEPVPTIVKPVPPVFEAALGPVFNWTPEYTGAARQKLSVVPGFFLRYGRFTFSNTGAFVTRRNDDIFQGLGADVHVSDTLRTHLGLRLDNGRQSSDTSAALNGLEDVRRTVRMQASITWRPARGEPLQGWHATAQLNSDLLDRGGGHILNFSAQRDVRLSPDLTWSYSGSLSAANGEYLRSYYGVTPEESVRTGYRTYRPESGWLDSAVSMGWRMDITDRWVGFWGGSVGRLLGPAADSPLTAKPGHWNLTGGIAYRF